MLQSIHTEGRTRRCFDCEYCGGYKGRGWHGGMPPPLLGPKKGERKKKGGKKEKKGGKRKKGLTGEKKVLLKLY